MHWTEAVTRLRRERAAGVLVTVAEVRGHAPRAAGAKMVVSADSVWGSVGGGNLEETAVTRSRALLGERAGSPETLVVALSDKARTDHGRQCCGGEVTLLLEPLPVVPAVAVFGVGHVGLELARILARHDLELHLVDSRADQLSAERLAVLDDALATVHVHHAPVPELVLGSIPPGTHVLVLTHEDDVPPEPMPGTDAWATQRFVDPLDVRHDMHVNIVSFEPGGSIPFPETHVMEHGLYVLEGKAVYLLNRDWVEVQAGDFMWLRAFCPQACYAGGPGPFRYLLYKDVNRHARLAPPVSPLT